MSTTDAQTDSPPRRRFRLQYSLRTLLVVVLLVAVGSSCLNWVAIKLNRARRQRTAIQGLTAAGGTVQYNFHRQISGAGKPVYDPPPGQGVLQWFLGVDAFAEVIEVFPFPRMAGPGLPPRINAAGLRYLKEFPQIRHLELSHSNITDADLAHLEGLNHLQVLDLSFTQVTDAGMAHLESLSQLQMLCLMDTKITDGGLVHLEGLTELRRVLLSRDSLVTDEGVARLRDRLPKCKIER